MNTHEGAFEINFAAGIVTISLTGGQLTLSRDVNIIGPGARTLIIRSGAVTAAS